MSVKNEDVFNEIGALQHVLMVRFRKAQNALERSQLDRDNLEYDLGKLQKENLRLNDMLTKKGENNGTR